jgi:hypothetical protein
MAIHAALGVPEVWRWNGEKLVVNLLKNRGTYRKSDASKAFPFLPLREFEKFLEPTKQSETRSLLSFRAWVHRHKKQWKAGR